MKLRRFTDILVLPALVGLLLIAAPAGTSGQTRDFRAGVEANTAAGEVDGHPFLDSLFLLRLYRSRGFEPLWPEGAGVKALLAQRALVQSHGLAAADFPFAEVEAAHRRGDWLATELLASELLARLVFQLAFGRLDPEGPTTIKQFKVGRDGRDPSELVAAARRAEDLGQFLNQLAPADWRYQSLRRELDRLRGLEWPRVAAGGTLEYADEGPRVGQLRRRLGLSGGANARFDVELQRRVRSFQRGHGLEPDGRVGAQTIAALNVTAAQRYAQVQVNLERLRWILNDLGRRHVLINIASFRARAYVDGRQRWSGRVQVGTRYRQTPSFAATVSSVVYNPTWTVPYTILRDDVLPEVRKDVTYLRTRRMDVVTLDGEILDPEVLDWNELRARRFPYRVRQRPGPDNALGKLKILFPNPHHIYMHDTPNRSLFQRSRRDFSSGCIRIEDPLGLASVLFASEAGATQERAEAAAAGRQTRRIPLEQAWEILIHYGTAAAEPGGRVVFYPDIYDRDAELLAAFQEPWGS